MDADASAAWSRTGLTSAEAAARLRRDGPNRLPEPRRRPAAVRFGQQLVHFFALMLWAAAVLALVAGMVALGVAIAVVVVVNALFAFLQENRADRAAERLRGMLPRVTVRRRPADHGGRRRRGGRRRDARRGGRPCAGGRSGAGGGRLLMNTSHLTGENRPRPAEPGDALFAGSFVVEGTGVAEITATGSATRLAGIARLTTATAKPTTPLTAGLQDVVRMIAAIAVGVGVVFFGVSLLLGNGAKDGFVFAIGVTVALVPEALLPTVTLSLAWGPSRWPSVRCWYATSRRWRPWVPPRSCARTRPAR
ncbi:MAG: cation-transporting P-type ATPase [Ilumatobacteraceae bacterium]